MAMKIKFTFKKQSRSTGLAGIGEGSPNTDIKLCGVEIGMIFINDGAFNSDGKGWGVRVEGNNPNYPQENCPWKWVQFKPRFATESEARQWVQAHAEGIFEILFEEHKTLVQK